MNILSAPATFLYGMLVCVLVLLATSGCGSSSSDTAIPPVLQGVDPNLVVRRGQLYFVSDSAAGHQLAEKSGMPCLLFFTADWCTFCHQMEATAFVDSSVTALADNFVCVLVDADREPEICQQFAVPGYPTIQFIAADGATLHRLVGRQSAPDLANGMRAALKRFAWLNDAATTVR